MVLSGQSRLGQFLDHDDDLGYGGPFLRQAWSAYRVPTDAAEVLWAERI